MSANHPSITVLDKQTIYDKWASLIEYTVAYRSDKFDTELKRVVFNSGDGAAIFLHDPIAKEIILVRQFRYGAYFNDPTDRMMTEVCAGMVDESDPSKSAIREAQEETGYMPKNMEYVGSVYATPGAHTEKLHLYMGQYTTQDQVTEGGGVDGEHEDIEVIKLSYEALLSMYENKEIKDAKTLILVQHWYINHYLRL